MAVVAVVDPFQLFPEEIWEMILKRVEEGKDARNVLKAYPKLDLGFQTQKMKRFWLFDQIIPFLTTWSHMISEQDLLNCRQVCKPWSKAVDEFLENQPYFRAYHPALQQTEDEVRLNLAANLHRRYPNPFDSRLWSKRLEYLGGTHFSHYLNIADRRNLQKFRREMESHERNPFLTKSLSIRFAEITSNREFAEIWAELLRTFINFGEHIWSFTFVLDVGQRQAPHLLETLTQALNLLPNLKYLDLRFQVSPSVERRLFERQDELPLPHLPYLETLKLYSNWRHCELLTLHFSSQLRRLEWNLNKDADGRDFPRNFPNLTELEVVVGEKVDFPLLTPFLLSVEAPQLVKLDIYLGWTNQSHSCKVEEDMFVWLSHFPSLKYFDFVGSHGHLRENGSLNPENYSFPSLEFLSVPDSFGLNYNFLSCLPSLQHLALTLPLEPIVYDLSIEGVIKIREQIQNGTIYDSNIWEVLPQLRSVTMQIVFPAFKMNTILTYEREHYHYFKERGIEPHHELKFRPDHPKWLELMRRLPGM